MTQKEVDSIHTWRDVDIFSYKNRAKMLQMT